MNAMNEFRFLARAAPGPRYIRGLGWPILGAVALVLTGLLVWAVVATLSWMWAQAPAVTAAGKQFAGEAMARAEQAAPGLKDQAEQWVPGAKEQLDRWLPGRGDQLPASDVSGTDIGLVPRYPGLVRSHFVREGQTVEVHYTGPAAFDAVLTHYVQGFAAAGYSREVVAATPEGERHRFQRDLESIDLSLTRHPGGLLEVRLKWPSGVHPG